MEYSGLFILSFWKTPQSFRVRITNQNCLHCLSFSWSLRIHLVLELLWREWIRGSWLCWRANPAGFPPTTVAAANKLKKILPDGGGGNRTQETLPGTEGKESSPVKDEILTEDRSHRSYRVMIYVKKTLPAVSGVCTYEEAAQVYLISEAEAISDLLGSLRGSISVLDAIKEERQTIRSTRQGYEVEF